MINDRRPNDDDLVSQIRRSIRAEERKAWSLLITFLTISALFVGILEFHLPMESTGMVAVAVLLVWIALMFHIGGSVPPIAGPYPEEILRKTIDDQHRRWRWIYAFMFAVVGGIAAMMTGVALVRVGHASAMPVPVVSGHLLLIPGPMVSTLAGVVDFVFFAVVAAFQVCFGPGFLRSAYRRALNDEHTRALQHNAAMVGYLLCVGTMSAVLIAIAIRPQWGLVAMPGAIAAVVILPGLYFLLRQWRAGRDG